MTENNEFLKIHKDLFVDLLNEAETKGYHKAIALLCSMEADGLHEMYGVGFAEWLEKKQSEVFS